MFPPQTNYLQHASLVFSGFPSTFSQVPRSMNEWIDRAIFRIHIYCRNRLSTTALCILRTTFSQALTLQFNKATTGGHIRSSTVITAHMALQVLSPTKTIHVAMPLDLTVCLFIISRPQATSGFLTPHPADEATTSAPTQRQQLPGHYCCDDLRSARCHRNSNNYAIHC